MMRVHEFAKQHALPSKQLLEALRKEGFDVKSHMSVLPDEAISFLEDLFVKKDSGKKLKSEPVKEQKNKPEQKKNKTQSVSKKIQEDDEEPVEVAPVKSAKDRKKVQPKEQKIEKNQHVGQSYAPQPFIVRAMSPQAFAKETGVAAIDVIMSMLKEGKACAINQLLDEADIVKLCKIYEIPVLAPTQQKKDVVDSGLELSTENVQHRLPVVVVMGHVDHGKTTLLDFIRKTRIAAREKGGITQHLGAYRVHTKQGDLVFLDTPGHEAFAKIRKRGASVADIAILVVAADDGVMPQTLESIRAIKALDIPVIVAINKIDRVDAQRIEVVKRQLTQHDLLPEEWGGDVMCVPISAKEGKGVDYLLEMIALQAEMMELKASESAPVKGYVLESKMLKGRGAVATVLCRQGTLSVGDFFKTGSVVGKVTSLTDSSGQDLKLVGPSVPVQVTGFPELPAVGNLFEVVDESDYRKLRNSAETTGNIASYLQVVDGEEGFNVILKADTNSSLEAIIDAFKKFSNKETKKVVLVRAGVGDISESDALLAHDTQSVIVGFNVKTEHNASVSARKENVPVHLYDVIYKLLEEVEAFAVKEKEIKKVLTKIGQATVLKVFNVKKLGVIAGCVVNDGRLSAKGVIALVRNRKEIARGTIKSLQRDKKTVKEVHTGFECAFIVNGIEEWEVDDIAECYLEIPA